MKNLITILFIICITFTGSFAQEGRPNHIKGGFYMKFGPSFPMGNFKSTQYVTDPGNLFDTTTVFETPKVGFFGDFGYLIYLGPAFANNYLRAGIDATFLSGGFHPSEHVYKPDENKIDYYYFFAGQKFGPLITVNPVDYLVFDVSWKLGFYATEYNDDWGYNMTVQEMMLGIRYRILAFSVNYQWGRFNYNDLKKENEDKWADVEAFKIMVGLKF